jgi:hypothetical protein
MKWPQWPAIGSSKDTKRTTTLGQRSDPGSALIANESTGSAIHVAERRHRAPTTDGREIRLRRITEPTTEQKSLLHQLGRPLPERFQFHRKCSVDPAVA